MQARKSGSLKLCILHDYTIMSHPWSTWSADPVLEALRHRMTQLLSVFLTVDIFVQTILPLEQSSFLTMKALRTAWVSEAPGWWQLSKRLSSAKKEKKKKIGASGRHFVTESSIIYKFVLQKNAFSICFGTKVKKSSCENLLYDLMDNMEIMTVRSGERSGISLYWKLVS